MHAGELAEIYDQVHRARGKDYAAEAAELARLVHTRVRKATSLLDVACGAGAHLQSFVSLFRDVEGLELSESMLAVARRRSPDIPVHQADMRTFRLGRTFDVITCMFGSIGYVRDTGELNSVLVHFADHLSSNGTVIIDPWWFADKFIDGYIAGDVVRTGGQIIARMSHSTRSGDASQMQVEYLAADSSGIRHLTEHHLITLFTRGQYEAAFNQAGLDVEYLEGFPSGRGLFVGRNRCPRAQTTESDPR